MAKSNQGTITKRATKGQKKYAWFRRIDNVVKVVSEGTVTFTVQFKNGRGMILSYFPGCGADDVHIWNVNIKGHKRKACKAYVGNRVCYKPGGETTIQVNEIIYQLDRLSRGDVLQFGEYNHFFPVCWLDDDHEEIFGVDQGDIVSSYMNGKHWFVLESIERATGKRYKLLSVNVNAVDQVLSRSSNYKKDVGKLVELGLLEVV